jgi:Na+/H+-dicarboxylate symporter
MLMTQAKAGMGTLLLRFQQNPLTILVVVGLSVYFGLAYPDLAKPLAPVGGYYISLLQMVVLPFVFSAVSGGLARLAVRSGGTLFLLKTFGLIALCMVVVALLSICVALIVPPYGALSGANLADLGNVVSSGAGAQSDHEIVLHESLASHTSNPLGLLLGSIFPANIYQALSAGETLKVVAFAILFGGALSLDRDQKTLSLLAVLNAVQSAAGEVIRWLTLILPPVLFCMVASEVATRGLAPFALLGNLVVSQSVIGTLLVLLGIGILAARAGLSPLAAFRRLHDVFAFAVTSRSSIGSVPLAVRTLTDSFGLSRPIVELTLPFGVTINRAGSICYYVVGTVFIAGLYHVELEPWHYGVIGIASIAAGLASSGATGVLDLALFRIVTEPLGLPFEAALVLFIAIDPVMDILRTLVNLFANCGIAALLSPSAKTGTHVTDPAPGSPMPAEAAAQAIQAHTPQ